MVDPVADSMRAATRGPGVAEFSARAGFLPVPLRHVPARAFRGIAVYLRRDDESPEGSDGGVFTLYRPAEAEFTPQDRRRLMNSANRCVYIRIADHVRFREQTETTLLETVGDATKALSEKSAIVYETSLTLIDELLAEADLNAHAQRLDNVARAVTTLAISDNGAFAQLFATSRHDFYTATHMVNVGTWMVPLAYTLGWRDPGDLARICQAGLLHDIGKIFIEAEILNKTERLGPDEWKRIREHPVRGYDHLRGFDSVHPLIQEVCRQHHERLDGGGYPDGLRGEEIHRVSRICAVVDSFDAMTALRPFKQKAMTVSEAILVLKSEAPAKYDPEVVQAWIRLLGNVSDRDGRGGATAEGVTEHTPGAERRRNQRFACDVTATLHILVRGADERWCEEPGLPVTVRDLSRYGMGLLSPAAIELGTTIRVYLEGAGQKAKRVHGRVVRCRPVSDAWHEIGVELFTLKGPNGTV